VTLLDDVAAATTRALDRLLSHREPEGRIHRACSSRLIESALTLHLLRDRPHHHERADRLRTYCHGAAAAAAAREAEPNPLAALDRAFGRAVAAAVLDAPDKRALGDALLGLASRLDHPSRGRKLRLIHALLAEIDPMAAAGPPAGVPAEPRAAHPRWTRLLLTAVALLEDARRPGRPTPAAAAWLASHQRPDGSWEKHVLLSVIALIALDKAGGHAEIVERGIDFVAGQMRPDGGIPFVPDVDVWLTALVGLGAATWGGTRRDLAPLAAFVARHQLASGAWAFTDGVDAGDADDTGTCAAFLERHGVPRVAAAAERGRRALLEFRNRDGGFATYVRGAPSEAEITARAVFVLGRHMDRHAAELGPAVRWLVAAQREDGTFPFEWTLSPYYPVAQVVSALAELPELTAAAGCMRDRAVEHLVRTRNPDGGWGPVAGLASQVLPTAYAVLALARAPWADAGALAAGIRFLLRAQRPSGAFCSPPDALGPRPFVFEVDLFPTVHAFLALAAAHERLVARPPRRPRPRGGSGGGPPARRA
jgi:squalene-hopene/tetraprenyl-beta-curcumene cyclase